MRRYRILGRGLSAVVVIAFPCVTGCLDRPVVSEPPTVNTSFTEAVNEKALSKIDILFDIDNSASMGDKQTYLIQAIPQMITRLVTPRCLDASKAPIPGEIADGFGRCATGHPEFPPVRDMHIGVVTSSLGTRGGDFCVDGDVAVTSTSNVRVDAHNDDQGHLINRLPVSALDAGASGAGAPDGGAVLADPGIATAALPEGGGFLSWYPGSENTAPATTPPAAISTSAELEQDFSEIVGGAGQSGCGIESQLESWYRFLIQPDPYATIPAGTATWEGVDTTIIQERHDFLRPDSLVVVLVLSDENDSEIDVRSLGGTGSWFLSSTLPLPAGTSACASDPGSPDCTICPQNLGGDACKGPNPPAACSDPACVKTPSYKQTPESELDWTYNGNLRHVHMMQKYGVDVQFPLTRYYNGLTSTTVPNRLGEYPSATSGYVGTNNCDNPLFAAVLPQASDVPDSNEVTPGSINGSLCHLTGGPSIRTPRDVFFAHIGGVPHQLLQSTPGDETCPAGTPAGDCPQKPTLTQDDWTRILGRGPAAYAYAVNQGHAASVSYDYTGISPYMIEAQSPRNNIPAPYSTPASVPPVSSLSGPSFGTTGDPVRPDPVNGREFITNQGTHGVVVDREYACIFELPQQYQKDCGTLGGSGIDYTSCDCVPPAKGTQANTPEQTSPLCSPSPATGAYTLQAYAKAYPTTRELTLAAMMGQQGIVSSLCPIRTIPTAAGTSDPLYGYNPAVNAIVDQLASVLAGQCIPPEPVSGSGDVPCQVLVTFSPNGNGPPSSTECASFGNGAYQNVEPEELSELLAQGDAGGGLPAGVTCLLAQLPSHDGGTCVGGTTPGWCYVSGSSVPAGSACSQQISYSDPSVVPPGATINLHCIAPN
jgi:hypothetical protein